MTLSRQTRGPPAVRGGHDTNKKSPPKKTIPGEVELQQWIAQAEYEVYVDPYRGIQSILGCAGAASASASASAAAAPADSSALSVANGEPEDSTSITTAPQVLLPITIDGQAVEIDAGPWRTQCTFDYSLVVPAAAAAAILPTPTATTATTATATVAAATVTDLTTPEGVVGETVDLVDENLDRKLPAKTAAVAKAPFSLSPDDNDIDDDDDDAYETTISSANAATEALLPVGNNGKNNSNSSSLGFLEDGHSAALLVRATCQSSCPSLIAWTSKVALERQKKARLKKKRKLADLVVPLVCGRRRHFDDKDTLTRRCACDYNPFCLGTLGGAMDDALDDWSRKANVQAKQQAAAAAAAAAAEVAQQLDDNGQFGDADDDEEGTGTGTAMDKDNDSDEIVLVATNEPDSLSVTRDWSDPSFMWYSSKTSTLLGSIRKSQWVNESDVTDYLQKILQGLTATLSLQDGVRRIEEIHQALIFQNPLVPSTNGQGCSPRQLRLSMPPGIENLGATCYLNTQMQCLAQNRVFVQGILSWRPPQGPDGTVVEEDRMSSVLSRFQKLVLRMIAGPHSSVDTVEFSDALGLDNQEQQDPNEFSRLLFDRMHASFQGSAGESSSASGSNLADLLPHLFQGVMMYETTCLTCKNKSRRTEEFMDLNLPIVHPKNGGIAEALLANGNTDVQYCLQEYCRDETLDGDNQYFCGHCGCKRDAIRSLTFQKLPPVLNVQISRYVYDRVKFMKKKLSDKVLLPLDLEVTAKSVERKMGNVANRYILVAVMRHKGTSAYSGHYVAEAKDWCTGQWFEFNDEKVVLLKDGPSCSFDPKSKPIGKPIGKPESQVTDKVPRKLTLTKVGAVAKRGTAAATDKGGAKPSAEIEISGSTDAYNMYYVEESFLAQSALDCLRKQLNASDAEDDVPTVAAQADIEREECYAELTRMCQKDRRDADRLESRRNIIRKEFIPAMRGDKSANPSPDDLVWVELDPFLQFMSCRERQSSRVGDQPRPSPLCSHKTPGLHPRVARRGKLIPKVVFDLYVAASLAEDQRLESDASEGEVHESIAFDKIVCPDCSREYLSELSEKLKRIRGLKYLYEELNPKELTFKLEYGPDDEDENVDAESKFGYAVSRKFITWFRGKFAQVLKKASVSMAEAKVEGDGLAAVESFARSSAEGLDGIDLLEFESSYIPSRSSDNADEFTVNKHITCPHGSITELQLRSTSTVFVPWRTWRVVKALFPNAIEHKRKRTHGTRDLEDTDSDSDAHGLGCRHCRDEVVAECDTRNNLTDLVQHCNEQLSWLVMNPEVALDQGDFADGQEFRLLHKDDIGAWYKFAAAVKRKRNESIQAMARAALFPLIVRGDRRSPLLDQDDNVLSDANKRRFEFLWTVFRPIMCKKHGKPVQDAVFQPRKGKRPNILNANVCCMKEDAYKNFLASLVAVSIILHPSSEDTSGYGATGCLSDARQICADWSIDELTHPSFSAADESADDENDADRFVLSSGGRTVSFKLDQGLCADDSCAVEYSFWQGDEDEKSAAGAKESATKKAVNGYSGVACNPIAVDSDIEVTPPLSSSSHFIRVYEAEADADSEALLDSLATCMGLPASEDVDSFIRRSTRKRKTVYPQGVVLAEDSIQVDFNNNLAALRLLLLERCTQGSSFELDHTVKLVLNSSPADKPATNGLSSIFNRNKPPVERLKLVDLSFDLSSESLRDLCQGELGQKIEDIIFPTESIMLVRQSIEDGSSGSVSKDNLMDHFIGLSNTTTEDTGPSPSKSRRKRTEKGFSGTFLSSSAPPVAAAAAASAAAAAPAAPKLDDVVDDIEDSDEEKKSEAFDMRQNSSVVSLNGDDDEEEDDDDPVDVEVKITKVASTMNKMGHASTTTNAVNKKRGQDAVAVGGAKIRTKAAPKSTAVDVAAAAHKGPGRRKQEPTGGGRAKKQTVTIRSDDDDFASSNDDDDNAILQPTFQQRNIRESKRPRRFTFKMKHSVLTNLPPVDKAYIDNPNDAFLSNGYNGDDHQDSVAMDVEDNVIGHKCLVSDIVQLLRRHPDLESNSTLNDDMLIMAAETAIQKDITKTEAEELVEAAYLAYLELIFN